jgi:hypothetical protein
MSTQYQQDVDYVVEANKGGDYLNGVSTLDLVMIQRHILGLQTLDNNYLMIAADVNNDGKVTASDLTELRKLILGVTNNFVKRKLEIPSSRYNSKCKSNSHLDEG